MNPEPSAKTAYTVLGGAVVTIAAWIITQVAGVEIPAEIAAAATTLVTAVIALLVPAKSGKYVNLGFVDGPDPDDALTGEIADDPEPEEITDPEDPSHVEVVR